MEGKTHSSQKDLVKLVNGLLRKSFGSGFKGNWHFDPCASGICNHFYRDSELGDVSESFFYIPFLQVGRFTEEDGSKLTVNEKYREKAEMYASLYREQTGRDVELSFVSS